MTSDLAHGAVGLSFASWRRLILVSIVVASLASCGSGDPRNARSWLLEDASAIENQLHDSVFTAVLVLPSKMCFGCNPAIREWRTLEDTTTALRVSLILAEYPEPEDARLLRVQRVAVNGVLKKPSMASRFLDRSRSDPIELLFYGASLIAYASSARDAASVGTSSSPVLREARRLLGDNRPPL